MRRDFGSHLPRLLGKPLNPQTVTAIYAAANEAIATWEPRVEVVATRMNLEKASSGIVDLSVVIRLAGETLERELDFPDLPTPEIIDTSTYEEILARKLEKFRQLAPGYTNIVEGDPIYMMAQVSAYDELNLRKQINNAYRQTNILYATGTNLDYLVANVNLVRQVKQEAVYDSNGVLQSPKFWKRTISYASVIFWHGMRWGLVLKVGINSTR